MLHICSSVVLYRQMMAHSKLQTRNRLSILYIYIPSKILTMDGWNAIRDKMLEAALRNACTVAKSTTPPLSINGRGNRGLKRCLPDNDHEMKGSPARLKASSVFYHEFLVSYIAQL